MFGLGTGEILLVLIIIVLLYGPKRLPHLAQKAGRMAGDVRRSMDEVAREFSRENVRASHLTPLDPEPGTQEKTKELVVAPEDPKKNDIG